MNSVKPETIDTWAIVELFGHSRIAGKIHEKPIAGTNMLVVDVPETKKQPAFTRMLGGAAIYAINPCTEELARLAAESINSAPVTSYDLNLAVQKQIAQLPAAAAHNDSNDMTRSDEYDLDEDDWDEMNKTPEVIKNHQ